MIRRITIFAAAAIGAVLVSTSSDVLAKSAKACAAQYDSSGKARRGRAAFIQRCAQGSEAGATGRSKHGGKQAERSRKKPVDPHAPPLDATTGACTEEYDANKAAIDGAGQSRAKFLKDCKNGTEVIPGKTSPPVPAPPVTAPSAPAGPKPK